MSESTMPAPELQKCAQLHAENCSEYHKNTNQDILSSNTVTFRISHKSARTLHKFISRYVQSHI